MAHLTQYSSSVPVIKFHIDQSVMTIGQDLDMDICVPEDGVADNHATLEAIKQDESYHFVVKANEDESLLDLNGETVSHAELKDGDWIIIGGVEFQFTDDGKNDIKEVNVSTQAAEIPASQPIDLVKIKQETTQKVEEKKEERPMTTKEFIENSRRNTRRRISF